VPDEVERNGTRGAHPGRFWPEAAGRRHKALSNPIRMRILALLAERERTVGAVASRVGRSAASASVHLTLLQGAGLIVRTRGGRSVYCSISAAGRVALNEAGACEFGPDGAVRAELEPDSTPVPRGLATEDPEDIELWVTFGAALIPYAAPNRPEWDRQMIDWFGGCVAPHLDELHPAALRALADERAARLQRAASP